MDSPTPASSPAADSSAQTEPQTRGQPEPSEDEVIPPLPRNEDEDQQPESGDLLPAEPAPDDPESEGAEVLTFPARKSRRGRKVKVGVETLRVDYVKESVNTMTFRIRWKEADGSEPVVAISRVSDQFFRSIIKQKGRYAAFKKQLIAGYRSRALWQSDRVDASAHRNV